jgi:hypothetical protein
MNKKAFTLIELIVWITISMILMVSVGIFVSSGMNNILLWQKVLENTGNFTDFANNLHTSFNLIQSWSIIEETASWIIFKRWQNFWEWGFSYIWTETLSWVYCESDSENINTNSVFIKTFIPFEEQWEDIFNDYTWSLTATGWTDYISYQKEHVIKDNSWNIIVWKWVFWDKFTEWANWTDIYLNSPTWLETDWTNLYISDTLNNRILYLDSSDKIHLLLDESDWLNEPTGLYYDDTDKALYIANSWNWEILKYSSKSTATSPTLTMSWFTETINKIEVSFSGANTNVLLNDYLTSSIWFPNTSSSTDYLTWTTNNLEYYFINYLWINDEIECNWMSNWDIIFNWTKPKIYCTQSWSWKTASDVNTNINEIKISNIINTWITWNYFIDLKLNGIHKEYFPYFTQSDNDLTTPEDNILEVLHSWLNYPTWIWWPSNYNEFWDWSYLDLEYNSTDTLLLTPVKSLEITNSANDLISLVLKYYKSYNCYNLDEKIERTFLLKKNLK